MKLIGLIGQARVGKNTVAEYLDGKHSFAQAAFADPLKEMLEAVFIGVEFREGDREQPIDWLGKSPRQLMQTLGTEWGRNCIHPDLWTILLERRTQSLRSMGMPVVISDVRFHNEADMILRNGGELWHILRPDAPKVAEHASELYDWAIYPRHIIDNNGTLDKLYAHVDALMEKPHGQVA